MVQDTKRTYCRSGKAGPNHSTPVAHKTNDHNVHRHNITPLVKTSTKTQNGKTTPRKNCTNKSNTTNHVNLAKAGINVIYSNVDNSLASKLNEIEAYIATKSTDIICITEAKPKNGKLQHQSSLDIEGYTLYLSDLEAVNTRGACIYIKSNIMANEYTNDITRTYKDAVWVSLQMGVNNILIGSIYRSGTHSTAIKYDDDLHKVLQHVSSSKEFSHIIITGDFNHGYITWNTDGVEEITNKQDEEFAECVRDTYLCQHITVPTRHRQNQQQRTLDFILP